MKKKACGVAALGLAAAVLTGCGSLADDGVAEEELRRSVDDSSGEAGEVLQGDRDEGGCDGTSREAVSGQEADGLAEDSGQGGKGGQSGNGSVADAGKSAEGADGAQETEGGLTDEGLDADPARKAMLDVYIAVLEDIYYNQVFPGEEGAGCQLAEGQDISSNSFAVTDIDFDGEDELIVSYTTTYMAGMLEAVYGYDSAAQSVRREFSAFPALTYYDNGMIREEASHNHGMASDGGADGEFWPYYLHQYDRGQDAYVLLAGVDAWSRAYRQEDYEGNPFPEDADEDGDGMVYYVSPGYGNELENPMDGAAYAQWMDSLLQEAQVVRIPYRKLTIENIYAIE